MNINLVPELCNITINTNNMPNKKEFLFSSEKANRIMNDYDDDGLDFILNNYKLEDIAEIAMEETDADIRIQLTRLIAYFKQAQLFSEIMSNLHDNWDEDQWNESQD